jgi:hypothetical protein
MPDEVEVFYNPENPKQATSHYAKSVLVGMVAGLGSILVGGVMIYFRYFDTLNEINGEFIAFFGGVIFTAGGVGLSIDAMQSLVPKKYKETFTESTAICIMYLTGRREAAGRPGVKRAVLPVFEYKFNGVTYQMEGYSPKDKPYSNIFVIGIGARRRIWINPENPRIAYIQRGKSRFSASFFAEIIFASFFLFPGIAVVVLVFIARVT